MEMVLCSGSLVLLAGGIAAAAKKAMTLSQALSVLVIAVVTCGVAYLAWAYLADRATDIKSTAYLLAVAGPTTLGAAVAAVGVVTRKPSKIR